MNYEEFLESKTIVTENSGFEIDRNCLNENLFEFQKDVVKWALMKGKAALFEECGLGKTGQSIEWAYQIYKKTNKNILVLAPLGVTVQTKEEARKILNVEVNICRNQNDVKHGINITNYEMVDHFNIDEFIGVVLDESSILKNYTGSTRKKLKSKFKNTPYKLLCTATPAPNSYMELLNQADFLGIMDTDKSLATYFINDMKTGNWRLKGHAVKDFWKWVSSWAVYVNKPSDLGYEDGGYDLPKLNEIYHVLEISILDKSYENGFFRKIDTGATSYYKEKRITTPVRVEKCKEIAMSNDEQYLIWCDTNEESKLLKEAIPEAVEVKGSDKADYKENAAIGFKNGDIRVLISKASIFGYGMNFQKCHNAIFCGLTYSYEDYYQALKRLYRFGQKHEVNTHIVIGSTENKILETVKRKAKQQEIMQMNIKNSIKEIQLTNFNKVPKKEDNILVNNIDIPSWIREGI